MIISSQNKFVMGEDIKLSFVFYLDQCPLVGTKME